MDYSPDLFQRALDIEHNAADNLITVKGLGRNWSWEDFNNLYEANGNLFEYIDSPGCMCGLPCGCYDG